MSKRERVRLRKVEKCEACGRKMRRTLIDRYQYVESGLSNVYLHGVKQYVCECGETVIGLANVERLHDLIFAKVLMKRSALTGDELRFLRKYMGMKAVDFAKMVNVDATSLSRWENGQAIGSQSDKLIRLAVGLAMTNKVKLAVDEAYRRVADQYLDFLNEINMNTPPDGDGAVEETLDIGPNDVKGRPQLSFRWGLSKTPAVELAPR